MYRQWQAELDPIPVVTGATTTNCIALLQWLQNHRQWLVMPGRVTPANVILDYGLPIGAAVMPEQLDKLMPCCQPTILKPWLPKI